MPQEKDEQNKKTIEGESQDSGVSKHRQEQSDPQLTELKGFTNPSEGLEPTLTDGKKSPDKAKEEYESE
jgi:hypothetical protein